MDNKDIKHIKFLANVCDSLTVMGLLLSYFTLLAVIPFTLGTLMKWVIVGHPVLHGAYDHLDLPERFKKRNYAVGWRKPLDMFSWTNRSAWVYEHNALHHGNIGTVLDPDSPTTKFGWLKGKSDVHTYSVIFYHSLLSGYNYFGKYLIDVYNRKHEIKLSFVKDSVIPHLLAWLLILVPLIYFTTIAHAVLFFLLTEALTGFLAFAIISATHIGGDIYRFKGKAKNKKDMMIREVMGTANYTSGNDFIDFFNGFLGYHAEHHLFPNKTHLWYRRAQPIVQKYCERRDINYVVEPLWKRTVRLFRTYARKEQPKLYNQPKVI